jgi:hypothetical protein
MEFSVDDVARELHRLFIGDAAATLRKEDRQKVAELVPLLEEVRRAVGRKTRGSLVDLCAGKSALGLLAATLVLPRDEQGRSGWRVVIVERDPDRVDAAREAATRVAGVEVEIVQADVAQVALPATAKTCPVVVVALHACGPASDAIIDRCVDAGPSSLLLVPCCYGAHPATAASPHAIPGQRAATAFVDLLPPQGLVGRRLAQAVIDAERTLRLQAGGFAVDVVEFVAPTVTPHNLLWRARRVDEPPRRARAAATLRRLHGADAVPASSPPRPHADTSA